MKKPLDFTDSNLGRNKIFLLSQKPASKSGEKNSAVNLLTEWGTLDSISSLAEFLGCSYSTARRYKKLNKIKCEQAERGTRFHISDVLQAMEGDERVFSFLMKTYFSPIEKSHYFSEQEPQLLIDCVLYPGFLMTIEFNYQGWGCMACCPPEIWGEDSKIKALANHLIMEHRKIKLT